MVFLPDVLKSRMASRTSWVLAQNGELPLGRTISARTRRSVFAARSASTTALTVGGPSMNWSRRPAPSISASSVVPFRTSAVSDGTPGPRRMTNELTMTPTIDTTMATAMRESTSQTPRRAAMQRVYKEGGWGLGGLGDWGWATGRLGGWATRRSATRRLGDSAARGVGGPVLEFLFGRPPRGSGGMADALASGASPGNRVEVQVLSSAPPSNY